MVWYYFKNLILIQDKNPLKIEGLIQFLIFLNQIEDVF